MNIVSNNAAHTIPKGSDDYAVVQALCKMDSVQNLPANIETGSWDRFFNVMLKVTTISTKQN